jgi:hypothetical protein
MRALLVGVPLLIVGLVVYLAETADARALEAREAAWGERIEAGDVVLQDLECGERCALIRDVTQSRYAHVGVVVVDDGERFVWEALGPVGPVPLDAWLARGVEGKVAVYRPRPSLRAKRAGVEAAMRAMAGRPYDGDYQWDDARIYCSELVAKAYRDALGRDVLAPHPVDLGSHTARVAVLSGGRLTSQTRMVTPRDLTRSSLFTRVVDELND